MTLLLLVAFSLIVLVLLIVIALQPGEFSITRSARIAAPPLVVFGHVNDFHQWEEWSPWAKLDPEAKNRHEGPASGVGAVFSWSGNNKVGEGRMTLIESRPGELIRIQLEFLRPMKASNLTEFSFKADAQAGQTVVVWTMSGRNGFLGKAMGLVMNCDKMVGGQFEQGLANLNRVVSGGEGRG